MTSDSDLAGILAELKADAGVRRAKAGLPRFPEAWSRAMQVITAAQSQSSTAVLLSSKQKLKALAHRVPFLGTLARLAATIARLPHRLGAMEHATALLRHTAVGLDERTDKLAAQGRAQGHELAALKVQIGQLQHENHLRLMSQEKLLHQLQEVKNKLIAAESSFNALRTHRENAATTGPAPAAATAASDLDGGLLDDFYWRFEERFRGLPSEVASRLEAYLPYLEKALRDAPHKTLLDVGCGRGEWLKLAQAKGFEVKGVDLNAKMVSECQRQQLPAIFGDGVRYLQQAPAESLAVVSGFHIVEHLPFAALMTMLREAYRTLAPGGFALFETPNPENILVGACTFYTDPTHKNPLPPPALAFMMEEAGFTRQECVRLRARPLLGPSRDDATQEVVQRFYEAPDYAILGFKDRLGL